MSKKNENKLLSFKVLSILLHYPESYWTSATSELIACLKKEAALNEKMIAQLESFAQRFNTEDLMDLQLEYVALFDQNRNVSLHLFEHIHGESRDRGQAMVDLMSVYEQNGLAIDAKELPDYLPLFLEFLSMISTDEALVLLTDCIHIIEKIASALAEYGSGYTAVFNGILTLAKKPALTWKSQIQTHYDPMAAERLDQEWAEEEVRFLANNTADNKKSGCGEKAYYVDVANITKRVKQPLSGEKS